MARLVCRSCREEVVPGDLICQHCRANLTAGDAVVDSAELDTDPDRAHPPEQASEPRPDDGERPDAGGTTAVCPECGSELPASDTPVCPTCLASLGGALVLRLATPSTGGGDWRHVVLPGSSLVLGRDPRESPAATALATYDAVSRKHARVTVDHSRRAMVADLDSTNGTFVDDMPVRAGSTVALHPGSRLRLGSSVLLVVEEA